MCYFFVLAFRSFGHNECRHLPNCWPIICSSFVKGLFWSMFSRCTRIGRASNRPFWLCFEICIIVIRNEDSIMFQTFGVYGCVGRIWAQLELHEVRNRNRPVLVYNIRLENSPILLRLNSCTWSFLSYRHHTAPCHRNLYLWEGPTIWNW